MDVRGDFLGPPLGTTTKTLIYKDRDRKIQTDCKQSLRIGKIRALNGCTGRVFRAATWHNHKNSDKIQTDCKQSLRIGKIRALNGCY